MNSIIIRLSTFTCFLLLGFTATAQDTLSFGGVYDLPGAEVRATPLPVSRLARQFTVEEVYRLPGTFYDPARLVALLPGVVQTNDQANHLSVRGNTPNANLWRLNGLAIVNPNHTANAGTFFDFPTLNGGGVNAISAQMLDNSGFFSGGLPVEYGYASGGTFDLRLRPGAKQGARQQVQAGFIGFDGMAEGPIGKSGNTSYLVNGRYSFTGLLADMGVDFGGETIRFADLNAHLHHQWEGGDLSVFTILGASSNVFRFTDEDGVGITEQKELFDIDFESALQVYGATLNTELGAGRLRTGVGFSEVNSERLQAFTPAGDVLLDQTLDYSMINANIQYLLPVNRHELKVGVEFLAQTGTSENIRPVFPGSERLTAPEVTAISPFVGYELNFDKSTLNLGLRGTQYGDAIDDLTIEPSISYELRGNGSRVTAIAERVSRPPLGVLLAGVLPDVERFSPVNNQFSLGYGRLLGGVNTQVTAFFQHTPEEYSYTIDGTVISANNALEVFPFQRYVGTTATRRYGVELEAAGGRKTEGWYYRSSLTLLRAETEQTDGSWIRDRYSVDFIGKVTVGREWQGKDRKERDRTYGLNLALITHGGERFGVVEQSPILDLQFITPQNLGQGFINANGTYFRPDLRLYKTKVRAKTTTTLALDIQNVVGYENVGNVYFDDLLGRPNERFQLGLIPVLSYRITWR